MRYAVARYAKEQREAAYRIYVAECLRLMTESSAKDVAIQSGGKVSARYMDVRFADVINPREIDNRTAEEIIEDVMRSAGIEVV